MRFEVHGKRPQVDESAIVAPTAVLSGDVTVGPGAHVSFGAVLLGEEAPVTIGGGCVLRENVVVRSAAGHPVQLGEHVLVGAGSALYGCTVGAGAFLATGVAVFHGAHVEAGAEVRIHGVVHVNSRVPAGATVPIGWVAVGDPASILPPDEHDRIWAIQKTLDFPGTVYGVPRDAQGSVDMAEVTRRAAVRDHPGWTPLD
ncbi:MAG: gamma carbonic anhydrase family protein [Planctomycetota bacterium]|jgi:carbonic anhydrase/acetyltransferase-like protein (isoleucine patch superfamily)